MKRFLLGACLLLAALHPLLGQKKMKPADYGIKSARALEYYEEGLLQARYRDRLKAIELFKQALELEPDFAHAHFYLGVNAWVKKKYADAVSHLERAYQLRPQDFANIEFYLGESCYNAGRYEEAEKLLQTALQVNRLKKEEIFTAERDLRSAAFAKEAIRRPVEFSPVNLGEAVNTERDEYLPFLTADDGYLLFTSMRQEAVGGYNPQLGDYSEDFYFSRFEKGAWQPARNLGEPINTFENEGAGFITQDGLTIFFTACNRPGGFGSCDIYKATRQGERWGEPELLGPAVNTTGWESQPCLSADGRLLFFTSSRPGGQGGRDIWVCEKVGDDWQTARNLGLPVNSPGNEDAPFLHADGQTLYFSSDYHPGFGQQDLFLSRRQPGGAWSEPLNLGYPLNTLADESNLFVNASGRRGFINSDREGGLGRSDLYEFRLDPVLRPQQATFLRGSVLDSLSRKPLAATIRLVDVESGDTLRQLSADPVSGQFLMSLPLDRSYAAFVQHPGYLFASKSFFLKQASEGQYFDLLIALSPIRKGGQVVLNNIFFESGKYELQPASGAELRTIIAFLTENARVQIEIQGHTDDVGSEADNLALSQRRADAVRSYLLAAGIAEGRVSAKGYGESQPLRPNDSEEGRAQNRRTEFKILETGGK
jgi:outer membrane protein OmpA-like peptidoglycan-associated protein/tetratricopeptide (TPR) repeat protein